MKSLIFKSLFLIYVFVSISLTSNASDKDFKLTIKISGISAIKGDIYIAVYASEEAFEKKEAITNKRLKVTSSNEEFTCSLPEGEYAVVLYHDVNKNKKLDKLFSVPIEPYGVSNNISGFPSYKKAKFSLNSNNTINIKMKN